MAISTCIVSGSVVSLQNEGLTNVTVKVNMPKPFLADDGTLIPNFEVSTTTDSLGAWTLTLIQTEALNGGDGIPLNFSFEFSSGTSGDYRRMNYTAIIPAQSTCTFDLLPSLTGF